jgi:hypothetical protein
LKADWSQSRASLPYSSLGSDFRAIINGLSSLNTTRSQKRCYKRRPPSFILRIISRLKRTGGSVLAMQIWQCDNHAQYNRITSNHEQGNDAIRQISPPFNSTCSFNYEVLSIICPSPNSILLSRERLQDEACTDSLSKYNECAHKREKDNNIGKIIEPSRWLIVSLHHGHKGPNYSVPASPFSTSAFVIYSCSARFASFTR